MSEQILVTRSSMPTMEEYIEEIRPIWESHWLTNMGEKHEAFQLELQKYMGVPNVELLTNGHMALELSLQAMNLQGEVITTPFTFASTTHAIVRNGLEPVFCDIDPETYTMDVTQIERLITDRTCAILPVHVYGNVCNIEEIERIAHKYELKVVYDAAHTFGETYKGRGIVLHTLKYGDTSMVAYLLTDVGGRRSYMVQGVRSRNGRGSKLALFQPMFPVEFEGLESPRQQMDRFKEVRAGFVLQSLPFDVRKSTMALFMAEVLYRLVRESEPNEALFDFVWGSAEALDAMNDGVPNFHLWFLANLSRFLGFCPGNDYSADDWFDIREGLYTKTRPQHVSFMTQECTRILRDMMECDVRCLAEIGLNRTQRVEFLNAVLVYFGYHLDAISAVQSVRILREVF